MPSLDSPVHTVISSVFHNLHTLCFDHGKPDDFMGRNARGGWRADLTSVHDNDVYASIGILMRVTTRNGSRVKHLL